METTPHNASTRIMRLYQALYHNQLNGQQAPENMSIATYHADDGSIIEPVEQNPLNARPEWREAVVREYMAALYWGCNAGTYGAMLRDCGSRLATLKWVPPFHARKDRPTPLNCNTRYTNGTPVAVRGCRVACVVRGFQSDGRYLVDEIQHQWNGNAGNACYVSADDVQPLLLWVSAYEYDCMSADQRDLYVGYRAEKRDSLQGLANSVKWEVTA